MLSLRTVKRVKKLEQLLFPKYINVRFQSRERAVLKSDTETFTRRYSKPLSTTEKKPLIDNILLSLYAGEVNKSIFEYPTVFRAGDTDTILSHGSEVEIFLRDAPKDQLSEDTLKEMRKLELFGLSIPPKYGGAGYNETECKFLQECTGISSTIGRFLGYNENFGCKLLYLYGTEEQKEKYLPRLAQGKSVISLAYLENGPLIDLSKIKGHAMNDEINKTYVLSAEKKWVHNADKADLFFVAVKKTNITSEDEIEMKIKLFIVERDTPGITVEKLKLPYAQENNLFDVKFDNVVVQHENMLGHADLDGFSILKTALSYNNVTDAALCCNIVKHIIYDATQFIQERNLKTSTVKNYAHIHENLASLVTYLYALESVIYLVTGRFDTYDNPDLFHESVLAKALAIDTLRIAIKKYTEILGRESFKSSGLLQEAIETVQYYSVFEENIEYLKIVVSADGIVHAGRKVSEKVKMIRKPFENSWNVLKLQLASSVRQKAKHNFKLELHSSLSSAADILEDAFTEFQTTLEDFFLQHGKQIITNEHAVIKFGDMATYIYASIASLSRASSSILYDNTDWKTELMLATAFAHVVKSKIQELISHEVKFTKLAQLYVDLGKETLDRKDYPLEHPLSRTY